VFSKLIIIKKRPPNVCFHRGRKSVAHRRPVAQRVNHEYNATTVLWFIFQRPLGLYRHFGLIIYTHRKMIVSGVMSWHFRVT